LQPKRIRAYLDSNVFIFAKERRESNSHILLNLIEERRIIPVISYLTLQELREYFSITYGRETAIDEVYYIVSLPELEIVTRDKVKQLIREFTGVVPEKDIPHLVAAINAQVDYFVTYNRHLIQSKASEHLKIIKQKDLVELLGVQPEPTDY